MLTLRKYSVCRLCLCASNRLMDIFEDDCGVEFSLPETLNDLLQMEVNNDDIIGLAWQICSCCLDKLADFRLFKRRCWECKVTFESRLQNAVHLSNSGGQVKPSVLATKNTHGIQEGHLMSQFMPLAPVKGLVRVKKDLFPTNEIPAQNDINIVSEERKKQPDCEESNEKSCDLEISGNSTQLTGRKERNGDNIAGSGEHSSGKAGPSMLATKNACGIQEGHLMPKFMPLAPAKGRIIVKRDLFPTNEAPAQDNVNVVPKERKKQTDCVDSNEKSCDLVISGKGTPPPGREERNSDIVTGSGKHSSVKEEEGVCRVKLEPIADICVLSSENEENQGFGEENGKERVSMESVYAESSCLFAMQSNASVQHADKKLRPVRIRRLPYWLSDSVPYLVAKRRKCGEIQEGQSMPVAPAEGLVRVSEELIAKSETSSQNNVSAVPEEYSEEDDERTASAASDYAESPSMSHTQSDASVEHTVEKSRPIRKRRKPYWLSDGQEYSEEDDERTASAASDYAESPSMSHTQSDASVEHTVEKSRPIRKRRKPYWLSDGQDYSDEEGEGRASVESVYLESPCFSGTQSDVSEEHAAENSPLTRLRQRPALSSDRQKCLRTVCTSHNCDDDDSDSKDDSDADWTYVPEEIPTRPVIVPFHVKEKVVSMSLAHPKWTINTLRKSVSNLVKSRGQLNNWKKQVREIQQKRTQLSKINPKSQVPKRSSSRRFKSPKGQSKHNRSLCC